MNLCRRKMAKHVQQQRKREFKATTSPVDLGRRRNTRGLAVNVDPNLGGLYDGRPYSSKKRNIYFRRWWKIISATMLTLSKEEKQEPEATIYHFTSKNRVKRDQNNVYRYTGQWEGAHSGRRKFWWERDWEVLEGDCWTGSDPGVIVAKVALHTRAGSKSQ